jgi:DNA-binding CsgD family transcriptional regulator
MLAILLDSLYGADTTERRHNYRLLRQKWELAEVIPAGEREYLVLRRKVTGTSPLTSRERHAVRLAMARATNKEIAWALGVSASTVGVFLWRAASKLGVTGRDSLFHAFAERYPDDRAISIAEWHDDVTKHGAK